MLLPNAAFVLGADPSELRKNIDLGDVHADEILVKGRKLVVLDISALVVLRWSRNYAGDVKPGLLRKMVDELRRHDEIPSRISIGQITAELRQAHSDIEARLKTLRELSDEVVRDNQGNPVLKATGVEVHRIAALLNAGLSVDAILEDYPSLTADQIAFSRAYALANPESARPYPKITAKAAMREADLSALDIGK